MKRILLIEDDENIVFGIKTYLEKRDFMVQKAGSVEEGKQLFNTGLDLILLDVNLPDGIGHELLSFIRSKSNVPIIFLTVIDEEKEIVRGLDLGADDYITKPFKLSILESRINTVLRRLKRDNSSDDVLFCGDFKLIRSQTKVYRCNEEINITGREYRLLEMFMENQNITLTRKILLDRLWDIDGDFVNDNTLTVTIKRLREKLEGSTSGTQIIKTIRGIGYRMDNEYE